MCRLYVHLLCIHVGVVMEMCIWVCFSVRLFRCICVVVKVCFVCVDLYICIYEYECSYIYVYICMHVMRVRMV